MDGKHKISLSNCEFSAIIDEGIWPKIRDISQRWFYHKERGYVFATPYSSETGKSKTVMLHRAVMDANRGDEIDHLNGDKLDNRKANLRFCTRAQNIQNRHIFKTNAKNPFIGVYPKLNLWKAAIGRQYLGLFQTAADAARAYNLKAREIYGELARFNVVPEPFSVPKRVRNNGDFKYIYYHNVSDSWHIRLRVAGREIPSRYFKTPKEAIEVRDKILNLIATGIPVRKAILMIAGKRWSRRNSIKHEGKSVADIAVMVNSR